MERIAPVFKKYVYKDLFIQNAAAIAAWRRSRRNDLNKTN